MSVCLKGKKALRKNAEKLVLSQRAEQLSAVLLSYYPPVVQGVAEGFAEDSPSQFEVKSN